MKLLQVCLAGTLLKCSLGGAEALEEELLFVAPAPGLKNGSSLKCLVDLLRLHQKNHHQISSQSCAKQALHGSYILIKFLCFKLGI